MKHSASRLILFVSVFAVGAMLAAPMGQAANEGVAAKAKKLEARAARRELADLKKYDTNGNGVLDPDELAAKKADAKAKRDAAILKKYDANGNGVMDADEQAKYQGDLKAKHDAAVLKKYDKNHNGVLDPDELAAQQANQKKMQALRDARARKAGATSAAAPAATSGPM